MQVNLIVERLFELCSLFSQVVELSEDMGGLVQRLQTKLPSDCSCLELHKKGKSFWINLSERRHTQDTFQSAFYISGTGNYDLDLEAWSVSGMLEDPRLEGPLTSSFYAYEIKYLQDLKTLLEDLKKTGAPLSIELRYRLLSALPVSTALVSQALEAPFIGNLSKDLQVLANTTLFWEDFRFAQCVLENWNNNLRPRGLSLKRSPEKKKIILESPCEMLYLEDGKIQLDSTTFRFFVLSFKRYEIEKYFLG